MVDRFDHKGKGVKQTVMRGSTHTLKNKIKQ